MLDYPLIIHDDVPFTPLHATLNVLILVMLATVSPEIPTWAICSARKFSIVFDSSVFRPCILPPYPLVMKRAFGQSGLHKSVTFLLVTGCTVTTG